MMLQIHPRDHSDLSDQEIAQVIYKDLYHMELVKDGKRLQIQIKVVVVVILMMKMII